MTCTKLSKGCFALKPWWSPSVNCTQKWALISSCLFPIFLGLRWNANHVRELKVMTVLYLLQCRGMVPSFYSTALNLCLEQRYLCHCVLLPQPLIFPASHSLIFDQPDNFHIGDFHILWVHTPTSISKVSPFFLLFEDTATIELYSTRLKPNWWEITCFPHLEVFPFSYLVSVQWAVSEGYYCPLFFRPLIFSRSVSWR